MLHYFVYPVLRHGVALAFMIWLATGIYYSDRIFSSSAWRLSERPAVSPPARPDVQPEAEASAPAARPQEPKSTSRSPAPQAAADVAKPETASVPAFMRVLRSEPESRPPAWKQVLPTSEAPATAPTPVMEAARPVPPARPVAPVHETASPPRVAPAPGSPEASPVVAERTSPPLDEKGWLTRARKAYWEGNKEQAVALYHQGLEQHPGSANMLGELGNIAFEQGRLSEALDYLRKAGVSLRAAGRTREADNLDSIIAMIQRKISERDAAH